MSRITKTFISAAMTLILVLSTVIPSYADGPSLPEKPEPVSFSGNHTIEVSSVNSIPLTDSKIVAISFKITNNDSKDLDLVYYWMQAHTILGDALSINMLESDKEKNSIAPKTSEDITYYLQVSNGIDEEDIIYDFVMWDFDEINYKRTIATFKGLNSNAYIVPNGGTSMISYGHQKMGLSIHDATVTKHGDEQTLNIEVAFTNGETRAMTFPINEYKYYILNSDNLLYEMKSDTNEVNVLPKSNKEIHFEGPVSITDESNATLIITKVGSNYEVPVSGLNFEITTGKENVEGEVNPGETFEYSNADGEYTITYLDMERLPWEDTDVIATHLTIANNTDVSLPIPNLKGSLVLDGVQVDEYSQQMINIGNVLALRPGAKHEFVLYTKIPYTYEASEIKVILQEIQGEDEKNIQHLFKAAATLIINKVASDTAWKIDNVGKSATVKIVDYKIYESEDSNLYYTAIEMSNEETRRTSILELEGYYQTTDGRFYPVSINEVTNKINPKAKALLAVTAVLPKDYDGEGLELVIGKGVNSNTYSESGQESEALVSAVKMELPELDKTRKYTLYGIDITPYRFSMHNIIASQFASSINISFNYELIKSKLYEEYPKGHQIIAQIDSFMDQQEITIDLESMQKGTNLLKTIVIDDPGFINNVNNLGLGFIKLTLFDEYNGHRKLIADQVLNWGKIVP